MQRPIVAAASIAFVLSVATSTGAMATAHRTFVASTGNDANPCSLVLPCRSFAAAIAQTLSGGEVIVVDSAGYGPMTITQSISIIAPAGVYAGITVASDDGVLVFGAGINVVLHGLTISSSTGVGNGIHLVNAAELAVESCAISYFWAGFGVLAEGFGAKARIVDTTISNSSSGISAGNGTTLNIADSRIIQSTQSGIVIQHGGSGTTTNVFIADTTITGIMSNDACIHNNASQDTGGYISATRLTITNCEFAIRNQPFGGAGTVSIGNSMVSGNKYGFRNEDGTLQTLGTNQLTGNNQDTSGVITTITQQ